MTAGETHEAIEAVFRIERARLIGGLARLAGNIDLAEELAQDALVIALVQWPRSGVPANPGAWLMTTAKRRGIDAVRRDRMRERKREEIGRALDAESAPRPRRSKGPRATVLATTSATRCWASSSRPATPCFRPMPARR